MIIKFLQKAYRFCWLVCLSGILIFNNVNSVNATTITENFESGSKTTYTAADVNLNQSTWTLDDALIGTSSYDAKNGSRSVRLRNSAQVYMQFDRSNGADTISIKHARYGSDSNSSWQLFCSTDSGRTWTQVGSTITTSSKTLTTANFTPNISGKVRCGVVKVDGTANRLNIDDIAITDYNPSHSIHLTMGNPSKAITNISSPNNYLLVKPQYALSYNNSSRIPNWVSWQLNRSWLDSQQRANDFRHDPSLPSGWYQVQATDYTGSGFDRGHMCPSGDRTKLLTDNSATFLMTNMIPQAPDNNQGVWAHLEDYSRSLAHEGKELYIISGGYGSGGTGAKGSAKTIANGKIKVPAWNWKVIVVLDKPGTGVSGVSTKTRVIAVDIPNIQGIKNDDWRKYRVSVDYLESKTGFDFLSNVSTSIQNVIESKVDRL